MRRPAPLGLTLALASALGLVLVAPVPAQAHEVLCDTPEAWNYAEIRQQFAGKYDHDGSVACEGVVDTISIKCWVIHRHSLFWHSHHNTDISDSLPNAQRVTVGPGPLFDGTKGDIYKTHCDGTSVHGSTSRWSHESKTITLW